MICYWKIYVCRMKCQTYQSNPQLPHLLARNFQCGKGKQLKPPRNNNCLVCLAFMLVSLPLSVTKNGKKLLLSYLLYVDAFPWIIRATDDVYSSYHRNIKLQQDSIWKLYSFIYHWPSSPIFVSLGINVSTVISCKTCLKWNKLSVPSR